LAVQAFWHRIGLILLVVRYIDLEHGADQAIADRADVAPGGRKSVLDMWPQTVNEAHAHSQVGRVHHIKLQEVSQLFFTYLRGRFTNAEHFDVDCLL
jgi:hypothetical protein